MEAPVIPGSSPVRVPPFQQPASDQPAALPPVTADDGIDPSPEYIAAREAALRAVRASKRVQTVTPAPLPEAPSVVPAGYGSTSASANLPLPATPEKALERSYTQALAAIGLDDLEQENASASGEIPVMTHASPSQPVPAPMSPGYAHAGSGPTPAPAQPVPSVLADLYADNDDDTGSGMPLAARMVTPESTASWGPNPAYSRRRHRQKGPIPGYTGEALPREKNPVRMVMGAIVIGLGLFLLFWYLPEHAPALDTHAGKKMSSGFTPELYTRAQAAAFGFLFVGLLFILDGLWFKPRAEVVCKRCKRYVIARRDGVFFKCPRSSHAARTCKTTLVLFALLIIAIGAILFTIAMGSIVRMG